MSCMRSKDGWLKQRWLILERDSFTCQYCGQSAPNVVLHVDHKIAVADGGTDDENNLVSACSACNLGKEAARWRVPVVSVRKAACVPEPRQPRISLASKVIDLRQGDSSLTAAQIALELGCSPDTVRRSWSRFLHRTDV